MIQYQVLGAQPGAVWSQKVEVEGRCDFVGVVSTSVFLSSMCGVSVFEGAVSVCSSNDN